MAGALTRYAFDDGKHGSNKAKVYISLKGVEALAADCLSCTFGVQSIDLRVRGPCVCVAVYR